MAEVLTAETLRALSTEELGIKLRESKEELFNLRVSRADHHHRCDSFVDPEYPLALGLGRRHLLGWFYSGCHHRD